VRRTPSDLHYLDRKLIAHEFPLGIEPEEYRTSIESEATKTQITSLRKSFQDQKIILGVDRLDYTKGIPQKFYAFDRMLTENPEWIGKTTMIQLCVPTRPTVEEYKVLRNEVEALVGRINGKHGLCPDARIEMIY
jgi:trehalose 6-phosphate synthase